MQQSNSFAQLVGVVLLLTLSYTLYKAKQDNAGLRGEIQHSATEFVGTIELPPIPLELTGGERTSLTDRCKAGKFLVIVVSSSRCRKCAELAKRWVPLSHARSDVQFVSLSVDGTFPVHENMAEKTITARSAPGVVANLLNFRHLPAVIVANVNCRVTAAGTGASSSLAALASLPPAAP
ncbi:MAG: hypothetical protein H7Z40_07375 [Phycisphaerae bacterium]|nr:hypothetical protein [Gemmatimonadaceae bacterium]